MFGLQECAAGETTHQCEGIVNSFPAGSRRKPASRIPAYLLLENIAAGESFAAPIRNLLRRISKPALNTPRHWRPEEIVLIET